MKSIAVISLLGLVFYLRCQLRKKSRRKFSKAVYCALIILNRRGNSRTFQGECSHVVGTTSKL